MLKLLWVAVLCGVAAYVANSAPIQQFFKSIVFAILALIVLAAFFQIVLGVNTGLPL